MNFLSFNEILFDYRVTQFLQRLIGPVCKIRTALQKSYLVHQGRHLNRSNKCLVARFIQVGEVHVSLTNDCSRPSPTRQESLFSKGLAGDHGSKESELLLPKIYCDGLKQNLRLKL